MDIDKKKLLEQLEQLAGSNFEILFEGALDGFAYYFSRLDNETGVYVDIIVEVKHKEITNFMECYDLDNSKKLQSKRERIKIKSTKIS